MKNTKSLFVVDTIFSNLFASSTAQSPGYKSLKITSSFCIRVQNNIASPV